MSPSPNTHCKVCGKPFYAKPGHLKAGRGIYCSMSCRSAGKWNTNPKSKRSTADRFWDKVRKSDIPDECWEWTGCRLKDGYGRFYYERKPTTAHRVAWILTNGPVPAGFEVCHHCDNRACCRPDHLFLGTRMDNMTDMVTKGRSARGERSGYRRHRDKYAEGEDSPRAKLTNAQAHEIKARYAAGNITQKELAQEYGVVPWTIGQIVHGITYKTA